MRLMERIARLEEIAVELSEQRRKTIRKRGRVVDERGRDLGEHEIFDIRTRWKPHEGILLFGTVKLDGRKRKVRYVRAGEDSYWQLTRIPERPPRGWEEEPVR